MHYIEWYHTMHHMIRLLSGILSQAACICLCGSQHQVTCRSQTSFVGIAGIFLGGGGRGEGGCGGERERVREKGTALKQVCFTDSPDDFLH